MGKASGLFISGRHLWWTILILVSLAAGVSSIFVSPLIIIAALFLLANVVLIVKYPFWGLLSYLMIFLLRPGEMYPSLSALRLELVTGLFVLLVVVIRQKIIEHRVTLPSDPITLTLVAFLAVMCLTIFTSYDKGWTIDTCIDFVKLLVFYYLIVSIINEKKKFIAFMSVFLLLIAYIAFDAFKSYMAGGFITRMGVDRMYGSTSAGGDPNTLAATLGATIPMVVASAFYFRNWFVKGGLWFLALGMAYLITITASRSGMLAFMGVLAGGFIYSRHKIVIAIAGILMLLGIWSVLPDQYRQRYMTLKDMEDINDTSSGRVEIWEAGGRMIIDRPFIGVGVGAFAFAYGSGDFGPPKYMQPHSLYIQLLAESGIIGFSVWFFFIYLLVKNLRNLSRSVHNRTDELWASIYCKSFIVSMTALFVSGLFGHNLYRYTWYMMAGLTVVMNKLILTGINNRQIQTNKTILVKEAVDNP
jgi:O-antigen ligase